MEQSRPPAPTSAALSFSLRARTAFEAAEEAFERALVDPEAEHVMVPADGWEALIGLAALYAVIPANGVPTASPALADRSRKIFRDALTNIGTHPSAEIREAIVPGFTIRTEIVR